MKIKKFVLAVMILSLAISFIFLGFWGLSLLSTAVSFVLSEPVSSFVTDWSDFNNEFPAVFILGFIFSIEAINFWFRLENVKKLKGWIDKIANKQ